MKILLTSQMHPVIAGSLIAKPANTLREDALVCFWFALRRIFTMKYKKRHQKVSTRQKQAAVFFKASVCSNILKYSQLLNLPEKPKTHFK